MKSRVLKEWGSCSIQFMLEADRRWGGKRRDWVKLEKLIDWVDKGGGSYKKQLEVKCKSPNSANNQVSVELRHAQITKQNSIIVNKKKKNPTWWIRLTQITNNQRYIYKAITKHKK